MSDYAPSISLLLAKDAHEVQAAQVIGLCPSAGFWKLANQNKVGVLKRHELKQLV